MKRKTTIHVVVALLVLVFAYDAINKCIHYPAFRSQLDKSPYTSGYSALLAPALPVIELIAAGLLISPRTRLAGLFSAFFLISLFTVHLLAMLNAGYQMPCACGEMLLQIPLGKHIVFNLGIILLTAFAIILYGRIDSHSPKLI